MKIELTENEGRLIRVLLEGSKERQSTFGVPFCALVAKIYEKLPPGDPKPEKLSGDLHLVEEADG